MGITITEPTITYFPKILGVTPLRYFSLKNSHGLEVVVGNWGARLLQVNWDGDNLVRGYNSLDGYINDKKEHGSLAMSRSGNRLRDGKYFDGERVIELERNWTGASGIKHNLHGGRKENRWSHKVWTVYSGGGEGQNHIEFLYDSSSGEFGFPGNVKTYLKITLTEDNEIIVEKASDVYNAKTLLNIVSHSYWNLNGVDSEKDVRNHTIETSADRYQETDQDLLPTGRIPRVDDTYLDFRTKKEIGDSAEKLDNSLLFPQHVQRGRVIVTAPSANRRMEVSTNQPSVQFYAGTIDGLAIETQLPVNLPNQRGLWGEFGNGIFEPGQTYNHKTVYKFFKLN